MEKKQCFSEITFGWSINRINCSSRFLYRLSCKTFFMATVSPVSKHFAYRRLSQPFRSKNIFSSRRNWDQITNINLINSTEWSSTHNTLCHVTNCLHKSTTNKPLALAKKIINKQLIIYKHDKDPFIKGLKKEMKILEIYKNNSISLYFHKT